MHLVAGRQLLAQEADGDLGHGEASCALTPSQGAADAWASRPAKWTSKCATARQVPVSRSVGQGWTIMAAWTPSKAPRSSIRILPPPPSSAGVPSTRTVSPMSSATAASARPGADGGGGDDVVPAGVADVGQGVVLGAHRHHELAVAGARLERGRQVVHALVDFEPPASQRPGHRPRRARSPRSRARVSKWTEWLSATSSPRCRSTTGCGGVLGRAATAGPASPTR